MLCAVSHIHVLAFNFVLLLHALEQDLRLGYVLLVRLAASLALDGYLGEDVGDR